MQAQKPPHAGAIRPRCKARMPGMGDYGRMLSRFAAQQEGGEGRRWGGLILHRSPDGAGNGAPMRVELQFRTTLTGGQTNVTNQLAPMQKLAGTLAKQVHQIKATALRREFDELSRRLSAQSGRAQIDAAVRRALGDIKKNVMTAQASPMLNTILLRWGRLSAGARTELWRKSAAFTELRYRQVTVEEKTKREGEPQRDDGERELEAQSVRQRPAVQTREETVTRTEVLQLIREIPAPDIGRLTASVAERLEQTLRNERRRLGK